MAYFSPSQRTLILVLGGSALFVGVCYFSVWLFLRDEPPPDDRDFAVARRELRDEENAYAILPRDASRLDLPDEKQTALKGMLAGKPWNEELAADLVARNADSLAAWHVALAAPGFQIPDDFRFDLSLGYVSTWQHLARLAALDALAAMRRGEDSVAFDKIFDVLVFGRRVEDCGGAIIHILIGQSIKAVGLHALTQLLSETKLSPAEINPLIERLESCRATENAFRNTLRVEYRATVESLTRLEDGGIGLSDFLGAPTSLSSRAISLPLLRPNSTRRMFLDFFRQIDSQVSLPYSQVLATAGVRRPTKREYFSSNAGGKMLFASTVPAYRDLLGRRCQGDVAISSAQIMVALRCYRDERGDLPDTLAELAPAYLRTVPLDSFDAKPLRYNKQQRIIYSVGTDLIDSGGDVKQFGSSREPTSPIPF